MADENGYQTMTPLDAAKERHDRHERELERLRNGAQDVKMTLTRLEANMVAIQASVGDILTALQRGYVTVAEFDPVKRIVYGLVGAVLLSVIGGILALVIKQ